MDELQAQTLPALDWHGIWPGYVSHDDEGLYFPQDLPTGIRLAVQQAECSDPVMARQTRWEAGNIHYPSLIKEGDRYRLWYCCFADPDDPWVKAGHVPGKVPGLWCYAEIVDGSLPNRTSAALVPALEGFSFADCDRLSGDELAAVVSWRGKSDLSALKGQKIHLRFRLARAQLFAVTL